MFKTAILLQKYNKNTKQKEYALVSKEDPSKILRWFGLKKPSEDRIKKEEKRIQFFKHVKKAVLERLAKEEKAREEEEKDIDLERLIIPLPRP